ncbi:SMI1/KNR4 family protein [Zobellia nedashkovskayae]|uniref:SMI1/KNR4 family protein n=1 Tax=Zobellia nedashkovskayae TaxID=2779510 RepID=UPI00188B7663|nr:SMI1/KNR4 family protein [Zobellia nedashkovskayae]
MEICLKEFNGNTGLEKATLDSLGLRMDLPKDYVELFQKFNGGEGFIGEEYVVLHKAEELENVNAECGIQQFDSKIFLIGNNGAGEAIGIDFRNEKPVYILIPYIFDYDAIIRLAENTDGLFKRIYENGYFST